MARRLIILAVLATLAACEGSDLASDGPLLDPRADTLGEALNEPTDGLLNET